MKQISLNTDWEFYESDESMSFVFQRPEAVTVNLPHDFIITKPRSPQAAARETATSDRVRAYTGRSWKQRRAGKGKRFSWI